MTITDEDLRNLQVAPEFRDLPVEDLGEGIVSGFSSIRYKGKAWALRHQGQEYYFETPTIDVVVLARAPKNSQAYYPGVYSDDSEGRAPVCSSLDGEHVDPDVEEPQAKSCSVCTRNEWHGPRDERKKDCQTHRRMAVLLLPTVTQKLLGAPLYEPVFLKVPPGSLQNLKKYGAKLKDANIPMQSVLTRLGFAPPNVSLFAITFSVAQMLKGGEASIIKPLINGAETQRLIGDVKVVREAADEDIPFDPPKQVETGIEEAFATKTISAGPNKGVEYQAQKAQAQQEVIPPKRIGRPPGSKNKPKEVAGENGGGQVSSGFAVNTVSEEKQAFRQANPELTKRVDAELTKQVDDIDNEVDKMFD